MSDAEPREPSTPGRSRPRDPLLDTEWRLLNDPKMVRLYHPFFSNCSLLCDLCLRIRCERVAFSFACFALRVLFLTFLLVSFEA